MASHTHNPENPDQVVGLEELLRLDPNRPFANTQDAVERLIPFYLLASYSAAEGADVPHETEHPPVSPHPTQLQSDAWQDVQIQALSQLQRDLKALDTEITTANTNNAEVAQSCDKLAIYSHRAAHAQERLAALQKQQQSHI